MTKKTFLGAMAVALAVALTGSALVASNMGFKLNYSLIAAAGGTSLDGSSTIALPDNRQTGLNTSKNLMDDIGSATVFSVSRFLRTSNTFSPYTGRKNSTGADFTLNAGEGALVRVTSAMNYIVVGSDDPTLPYQLKQAGPGDSLDGSTFFAYNYHQTASTAKSLMDDIGSVNVFSVSRFLKVSNTFSPYTGRKNSTGADFTLAPGEAYLVRTTTTVNYLPSHY